MLDMFLGKYPGKKYTHTHTVGKYTLKNMCIFIIEKKKSMKTGSLHRVQKKNVRKKVLFWLFIYLEIDWTDDNTNHNG